MATDDFFPFIGEHCESTTLVNMLRNRAVDLSEPMAFGLGQGLSFLYWHSSQMPGPFLGGRVKPDHLIRNAATALGLELHEHQTDSRRKAEASLIAALDEGDVVGLKLDRYYLDYANEDHHFAAHYIACFGEEDGRFVVAETSCLGVQTTSRESMAEARSARGPMSSRNLSFRLGSVDFDPAHVADACRRSIQATAEGFLNPAITNLGFKGIAKTSTLMRRWCDALDEPAPALARIGTSMEEGGTGGGFFRTLWARFLEEAAALTGTPSYDPIAARYHQIAKRWTEVADLLREPDDARRRACVNEAADIVAELAVEEREAMQELRGVAT
jgi:hypothetical protein